MMSWPRKNYNIPSRLSLSKNRRQSSQGSDGITTVSTLELSDVPSNEYCIADNQSGNEISF